MSGRSSRWIALIATFVILLFTASLRDVSLRTVTLDERPSLPADLTNRDATLTVRVVDSHGAALSGALLRVYAILDGQAHLAAIGGSGPEGDASFDQLPHGETWVMVRRDGFARSSTRLVLEAGARHVELRLSDAHLFEVVAVDMRELPIRGVTATLYSSDPIEYRAATDRSGLAQFDGLPAPPYAVEVSAPGFSSKVLPQVGLDDSPLFVKLEQLGSIEVAVVNPDRTPAANATVFVAGSALWPARRATTDVAGNVIISGLPRGFYDLRAERGDLVSATEHGLLLDRGETKTVILGLLPGKYVTVLVTDGDGDDAPPVPNADVALVEHGISSFPRYGRTDSSGHVVLGPVYSDDATISARASGFVARSAVPVESEDSAAAEVQVPLLRGGILIGSVVDERDYPIDGAELEVIGIDTAGMPIVESSAIHGFREDHFAFALPGATPLIPAGELGVMPIVPDVPLDHGPLLVTRSQRTGVPWLSGGDGTFSLQPVTPGRVRIVARHPNYVEAISEAVQLVPGATQELVLVMRQGGALEGRVVEANGAPVASVRVEVAAMEGSLERITYTADDGTFAFAALPHEVLLSVSRANTPEHIIDQRGVRVAADEITEIEIELPEQREEVALRIVDERGYPIDRVQIAVQSLVPSVALRRTLFSDDAGLAALHDAQGLALRLVLTRSGRAPSVAELDDAPKQVELTMLDALEARGEVVARLGLVADAKLTLLTATGHINAYTDDEGAFHFKNLAAGKGRVLIVADGYVPQERAVEIDGDSSRPIDLGRFELTDSGTISGQVIDEQGDPIVGARVAVGRVPTYLPLGALPIGVAATDAGGRFKLTGIEPGTTDVEALLVGFGRDAVSNIVVHSGETTDDVRIVLRPGDDEEDLVGAASLGVTLGVRSGAVVFEHVPLDGEASRAGILAGDQLLRVDGEAIRSIGRTRHLLTGPLAEELVLTLFRAPDLRWSVRVRREKLRR